eukprot:8095589-Karenia_brevis.AAC.1
MATWPSCLLYNIIMLMVKPQGGTRPIAVTYIQKWERANAGPWDAAVEGSSALRAALVSMFGNELAYYRNECTLST